MESTVRQDVLDVLWAKLGTGTGGSGRPEVARFLRTRRVRRRADAPAIDPELASLLGLIAVESSDGQGWASALTELLTTTPLGTVGEDTLPTIFQAYVRAIGRIVAAEAHLARELLAGVPPERHAQVLEENIDRLLPAATRGFDMVHRLLLLDAIVEALAREDEAGTEHDMMGIAMVDLVGSTRYLIDTRAGAVPQLVDALFAAGQGATAHRAAHVVKYVGDGLFLAARDLGELADAALEVIATLERELPVRARGGLTWGPVVQRAGDLFGLPINLAHILTKSARPGMLLATEEAAARLPADRRGRPRTVPVAHPAVGTARVATVRPAG